MGAKGGKAERNTKGLNAEAVQTLVSKPEMIVATENLGANSARPKASDANPSFRERFITAP